MKKAFVAESESQKKPKENIVTSTNTFSHKWAFWVVAYAFAVTLMESTLPTPLYVVYQRLWHFSPITLTLIFATYALGVLLALLCFGRLSDQIGRRKVLLSGVVFVMCASLFFVFAQNIVWLFIARLLTGIAVGLCVGTATATLTELRSPGDSRYASLVGAVSSVIGFGLGPLLSGVLVQYLPWPTHLVFLIDLGLLVPALPGVSRIPETVQVAANTTEKRVWRPQRLGVPPEIRLQFAVAAVILFCGFSTLALFASLAPSFTITLLHMHNLAVSGAIVALVFGTAMIAQLLLRHLTYRKAIGVGSTLLIVGLVLMVVAFGRQSLLLLFVCAVFVGFGQGLAYMGSLTLVNLIAPARRRGEVISSYFVAGYIGNALPAGVGVVIAALGSFEAILVFALLTTLLVLAVLVSILLVPRI